MSQPISYHVELIVGIAGLLLISTTLASASGLPDGARGQESDRRISVNAINDGHTVQLAIHWNDVIDREMNGEAGDGSLDVNVRTKYVDDNCPNIGCHRLDVDMGLLELRLPEESHYVEEPRECEFYPGCSYTVELKYDDSRAQQEITIPECVNETCKCDYIESFPAYSFNVNYDKRHNIVQFEWNISAVHTLASSLLSYIELRYYNTHGFQAAPFDVGAATYEPLTIPLDPNDRRSLIGVETFQFKYKETANFSTDHIKVEVRLVDSKNCHSNSSVYYVQIREQESQVTGSHLVTIIMVLLGSILVFAVIFLFLFYSRSKFRRHIIAKLCHWPIDYSNIDLTNNCSNSMTSTSIPMQQSIIYVDQEIYEAKKCGDADEYEISPNRLTIVREIGKGNFGRVFEAFAVNLDDRGNTHRVAVKRLKKRPTEDELEEFVNEIKTMKKVGYHENIISILGCCTLREPVLVIMEYVGNGDLQRYLQAIRAQQVAMGMMVEHSNEEDQLRRMAEEAEDETATTVTAGSETDTDDDTDSDASYIMQKPMRPSVTEMSGNTSIAGGGRPEDDTTYDQQWQSAQRCQQQPYMLDHVELQNFAIQIANGMSHLEELGITHRDLAARNILIDEHKRLKISDFGLARTGVYVTVKHKKVPLRWLAIEAMRRYLYSSKSDVWAFGVVLWEIGTLGGFPYSQIENHALLSYLMSGNRLAKPENCSDKLYDLMLSCWHADPMHRPSFQELLDALHEPEQKIYIDLDGAGMVDGRENDEEEEDDDDDVFMSSKEKITHR